jgi:hypothetical protein
MEREMSKLRSTVLGLTLLVLGLSGFVTAASATAATQYWAGTSEPATLVTNPGQQEFKAKSNSGVVIQWNRAGGPYNIACGGLAASGHVENPAGGGAGVIESSSLTLSGCYFESANVNQVCEIENSSLLLPPLASTAEQAGADVIKTSFARFPFVIKPRLGKSCPLSGQWALEGEMTLPQSTSQPGTYMFTGNKLMFGGANSNIIGAATLWWPPMSTKLMTESSASTPGSPHWFLGSSYWTTFGTGSKVNYGTAGEATVVTTIVVGTAKQEIICQAPGDGIAGSLENSVWGGTTQAQLVLAGCVLHGYEHKVPAGCYPPTVTPNPLSGNVEEGVGVTRVTYSPTEGEVLMTIAIQKNETSSPCVAQGTYQVKGKLRATAVGDGNFELSGFEEKTNLVATTTGKLFMKTAAGEALRIQSHSGY